MQIHVSQLVLSVFPTDTMMGVYERLLDATPPSQLSPKRAGPRGKLLSHGVIPFTNSHACVVI